MGSTGLTKKISFLNQQYKTDMYHKELYNVAYC